MSISLGSLWISPEDVGVQGRNSIPGGTSSADTRCADRQEPSPHDAVNCENQGRGRSPIGNVTSTWAPVAVDGHCPKMNVMGMARAASCRRIIGANDAPDPESRDCRKGRGLTHVHVLELKVRPRIAIACKDGCRRCCNHLRQRACGGVDATSSPPAVADCIILRVLTRASESFGKHEPP